MVAIISRAVYERDLIDSRPGEVVPLAAYLSTNAALKKLEAGGRLFLVTIRPPKESLWLVAVLEQPTFDGEKWTSPPNTTPIRDITELRGELKFENGKGLPTESGKLGMSLQTPRVLTSADVALLLPQRAPPRAAPAPKDDATHPVLNAHEPGGPAPCLCKKCLPDAPESFEFKGQRFVRRASTARGRRLAFWVPEELADVKDVQRSVAAHLSSKLRRSPGWKKPASKTTQSQTPAPIVSPAAASSTARAPVSSASSSSSAAPAQAPVVPPAGGLGSWLKKVFGPK
jgi:hypothetical protein